MKRLKLNSITHNILRMGGVLVLLLGLLFSCSDDQTVMHTVTFNLDGGSFQDETEMTSTVRDGSTVAKPKDPIKDSTETTEYEFNGWYSDEACTISFDFSVPITEDTTIYAKWDSKTTSTTPSTPTTRYTITYTAGTENPESFPSEEKVSAGSTLKKPEDPVLKKDDTNTYVFLGWYNGENLFDFSTPITQNITLEARWSKSYYNETDGYTVVDEAGFNAWKEALLTDTDLDCTLECDITLPAVSDGESNWTPISTYSGTFDGKGHTISKMTISEATEYNAGFIRELSGSGTVKNLGLTDVNIVIQTDNDANVGAVAAHVTGGKIIGCYSSGKISVTASGTKTVCVGGIVGNAINATNITACYSFGEITVTSSSNLIYAGGISGQNLSCSINACYFTGSINEVSNNNEYTYIGAISGRNNDENSITACYWSAKEGTTTTPITGIGYGNDTTTQVTGNINWETAREAMNDSNVLSSDFAYKYVENTGSDKDARPLIIQPKATSET